MSEPARTVPQFQVVEWKHIRGRGFVALVLCDAERDREKSGIVGEVLLDGEPFDCVGVERYALRGPIQPGERVGLIVREKKAVTLIRQHELGEVAGAVRIDHRNGMRQAMVLHGDAVLEFDLPPAGDDASPPTMYLTFEQDAVGGRTVAWPPECRWQGSLHAMPHSDPLKQPNQRPGSKTIFPIHCLSFGPCVDIPTYFDAEGRC